MSADFVLHPRLAADTHRLADLELCSLLLMDDARFPWCILVPRRSGIREIYELDEPDRVRLLHESCALGRALMLAFGGSKLNVAAIGNVVAQLHLHHVVRFEHDAAWPAPVWGRPPAQPYDEAGRRSFVARLAPHLAEARLQA
jgi:diadenosine tetraphosphate (Ap4A) HIT family hydrolase